MLRKHQQFGSLLAIVSFTMMLGARWLHSPLHHVVNAVQTHTSCESQADHCHNTLPLKTADSDASGLCAHAHGVHKHGHHAAQHSADENSTEQIPGSAKIETGAGSDPCQHHHHPDNDCRLCEFLAENIGVLQLPMELSIVESVQTVPDSVQIVVDAPVAYRQLVRGPPTFS